MAPLSSLSYSGTSGVHCLLEPPLVLCEMAGRDHNYMFDVPHILQKVNVCLGESESGSLDGMHVSQIKFTIGPL